MQSPRPLSPEMRQAVVKLDKTLKEYKFLCENHIDSPQELVSFITEKREQIGALEKLKAQGETVSQLCPLAEFVKCHESIFFVYACKENQFYATERTRCNPFC